jgi:hypothetical protein
MLSVAHSGFSVYARKNRHCKINAKGQINFFGQAAVFPPMHSGGRRNAENLRVIRPRETAGTARKTAAPRPPARIMIEGITDGLNEFSTVQARAKAILKRAARQAQPAERGS